MCPVNRALVSSLLNLFFSATYNPDTTDFTTGGIPYH